MNETFPNTEVLETKIIDANVNWLNLPANIREVIRYRYMLINLVKRDVKVRYRNSVLGVLWSMLNPLLMMLVFSLIFGRLMPQEEIRQYAVFFLVGLLPWQFFSGSLLSGTVSILTSGPIIKKVYFPRELIPMSAVLANLVNILIAFIVLAIFLFASGLGLTVHALWLPVLLFTQLLFTMGLVFVLSAFNVFYRDVIMILDVVMLAWFFLTPLVYPLERLGESQTILGITFNPSVVMRWVNPMASIIDGYRTVLWGTMGSQGAVSMDLIYLLRTFITAAIVFIIGYMVFSRLQHLFAEKL
jgi:ABC-type polysaccharide/polyol phosphate export permease